MNRRIAGLLALTTAVGGALTACDITVTNEEGEEQCLDDFLADLGEDRSSIEAEAEQRGIDASELVVELAAAAEDVVGSIVDCSASGAFIDLADGTGGRFIKVNDADEGGDKLVDEVQKLPPGSDVMIVLDATCSMSDDLAAVKSRLGDLLDEAEGDARFGLVTFRDKQVDTPWYEQRSPLVSADDAGLRSALNGVQASGGGDFPESLYDAVAETLAAEPWGAPDRAIIALTDASSLEPPESSVSLEDVIEQAKAEGVVVTPILVSLF